MSAASVRLSDIPAGMLAGCDRLVHPAVDAAERERQRRMMGTLLAAPFVLGPVLAVSFSHGGTALALALLCAAVAGCWALALLVALTAEGRLVGVAALGAAAAVLALASVGGGLPVLLLSAALAFEAWWVERSRHAAIAGIVAAVAVFPLAELAGLLVAAPAPSLSAGLWLWTAPAALGAAAFARLAAIAAEGRARRAAPELDPLLDRLELSVLELAPSGEIVAATAAAATALGVSREVLVGRPLLDRVHVGDRVAFLQALADAGADQPQEPRRLVLRLRVAMAGRPGDRFHPFEAEMSARPDGAVVMLREDRSAGLREALAEAQARADNLDIAKGRFLAAVSHELRTPLNSIIGFSDMLLHGMAGPLSDCRQEDYVGLIRESGGHLLSVVNAILDVSKIQSGAYGIQPEPFPVKEAVDLCHAMLTPQAEARGLTFLVRTRPDAGEITADRRAVQQIIINLAANAIKFTEPGGKVTVEAVRSGAWLRLIVSDTGIGMSEDDLARIGEPFVQASNTLARQFEGTGLGLSLVKGLVQLHEGEMSIESAPGEGTLVTVALPVAGPRLARAGEEHAAAANGGTHEAFRKIA